MLKAVRFDEKDHQHLLRFINEYRNEKGKPNDSEAVRFLMQAGYESLSKPNIDLNNLKIDIVNDIVNSLSNKLPNQQPIDIENIKKDIAKDLNKKRKSQPVVNMETLKKELLEELKKEISQTQPVAVIQTPNQPDAMTMLLSKLIDKLDSNQQPVSDTSQLALDMIVKRLEQLPENKSNTIKEIPKRAIKENTVEIPVDSDSLLANMLGNANR